MTDTNKFRVRHVVQTFVYGVDGKPQLGSCIEIPSEDHRPQTISVGSAGYLVKWQMLTEKESKALVRTADKPLPPKEELVKEELLHTIYRNPMVMTAKTPEGESQLRLVTSQGRFKQHRNSLNHPSMRTALGELSKYGSHQNDSRTKKVAVAKERLGKRWASNLATSVTKVFEEVKVPLKPTDEVEVKLPLSSDMKISGDDGSQWNGIYTADEYVKNVYPQIKNLLKAQYASLQRRGAAIE